MNSVWVRYAAAAAFVAAAALVKYALGLNGSPFLMFFSAIMLSAWLGGFGPGILSTAAAALVSGLFFFDSAADNGGPAAHLLVFALEGTAISFIAERFMRSERKAGAEAASAVATEQRYRHILDNIGDYAIFTLDEGGNVTAWSEGARRVKGWAQEEIVGKNISVLYPPEAVEAGLPRREIETAVHCGVFDVEGWRVKRDGTRFWAQVHIARLKDDSGGLVEITRDVTDRKKAEEEAQRWLDYERSAREQAERHNRLKDEFLATLSHELRTPLTMVSGWANLMRNPNLPPAAVEGALEAIERNAHMLTQLVDDLLDVSRIITGKMAFNPQPVDLAPIIEAAIENVRPTADAKNIRIRCLLDTSRACCVNGVPSRIQQVLWNILSNAIKFTPADGQVEVTLEQAGSAVEVKVRDSGSGIPAEFLPHVFERFSQADSSKSRKHGGLGLGLAIVRHLVELHGGNVRADSEGEGSGATFTVRLPVLAVREAELAGARAPGGDREGPCLAGMRVMVVDDDDSTRELLATTVRIYGGEVVAAGSGKAALTLLAEWRPTVIVSDVGMPLMDGYEFIRHLRQVPGLRDLPAMALTAYSKESDRLEALSAGFDRHMSKPVDPSELARAIADLGGNAPSRESNAA